MRITFLSLVTLATTLPASAQPDLLSRVLDPVVCEADPAQRYVLYVPSGYTSDRPWPAIFCFDASARGRMPVERLQAAAERHGFIIAGSLNSRNGPWAANVAAAQAMMRDVSAHFRLDPRRGYTTGVSGGARVATALALTGTAKGVIACAAGFPTPAEIPSKVDFPFFGTAGTEDFNHGEMVRLDRELESRRAPHRIVIFPGGHEWAPATLMMEAVEWLELQAMRSGARPRDDGLVQTIFAARQAQLPAAPGLERWRALKSLAADFADLVDVTGFQQAARELGTSPEVRAGLKAERTLAAREEKLLEELGQVALTSASRRNKLVMEIRQMAGTPDDNSERQMARRVIASFSAMANETAQELPEEGPHAEVEVLLEMATELRPEHPRAWFGLARARARRGANAAALAALQGADAAGFSGAARLETEAAFAKLRSDPVFLEVLASVRRRVSETASPASETPAPATALPTLELPVMKVSAALAHVEVRAVYLPNARADLASASPAVLSHLRVESVRPGTAAERAGLSPYMDIIAIQGARVRGLSDDRLHGLLARPAGPEIVLTVRDSPGARERELRITLR